MNPALLKRLRPLIGVLVIATITFYYAGLNMGLYEIGFIVLFPMLFALTLVIDKTTSIFRKQESFLFLLFILLSLVSVFYPYFNMDYFVDDTNKIVAAFMGAYIAIALSTKLNLEDYFHIGFIVALVLLIFFEYRMGNFSPTTFYAPTASRDDFSYNANYYSYMSLFANFSILRLHLKYKKLWTIIGVFLVPVLGLAISFTTQSRSGLIFTLLINALFWFWVNNPKLKNPLFSIVRKGMLVVLTGTFLFYLFSVYSDSSIEERVSATSTEDSRGHLAKKGFEVFADRPLTGVGTGHFPKLSNTGKVTHNNYIEALSENGLIIGSIVILVFVLPFFKSFKLFLKRKSSPEIKLNLLFFSVFLLFNNIYIFYKASYGMMFFFVMLGIHYNLSEKNESLSV